MSADLYLHAMTGVEPEDLDCFFAVGPPGVVNNCAIGVPFCKHWTAIKDSPSIWIGQVSWTKAGLTGKNAYIPEPVEAVRILLTCADLHDTWPVLDEALKRQLVYAASIPNERAAYYQVCDPDAVETWLDKQMGQRLFPISA